VTAAASLVPSAPESATRLRAVPALSPAQALEHKGIVYHLANLFARTRPDLDADDLAQEGLIELLAAARTWRADGGAPFGPYAALCIRRRLATVAKRESRRGVSGRLSAQVGHVSSVDDDAFDRSSDEGDSIDTDAIALREAVALLPEQERRIVKARLAGERLETLGGELGRSRQRAWQIETGAVERLRGLLDGGGPVVDLDPCG
jgi:RNA polymerase sigma factor (sigma-70 family)